MKTKNVRDEVAEGQAEEFAPQVAVSPVTSTDELISPEQASAWLRDYYFFAQRTIRRWHVEKLVRAIREGKWEITTIKLYRFEGKLYLTDGQHRLTAIVEAGQSVWLGVMIEETDDWNKILVSYGRMEGVPKTDAEALYAAKLHESTGIAPEHLGFVARALKPLMNGFSAQAPVLGWRLRDTEMMMRGVLQWQEEARLYFDAIKGAVPGKHRNRLTVAVVMAVAFVTLRYRPKEAFEFWRLAANNDKLEKHTGPWLLCDADGVLANLETRRVNVAARKVAACWNAYIEKRAITRVSAGDLKKPINIEKTPYKSSLAEPIREQF